MGPCVPECSNSLQVGASSPMKNINDTVEIQEESFAIFPIDAGVESQAKINAHLHGGVMGNETKDGLRFKGPNSWKGSRRRTRFLKVRELFAGRAATNFQPTLQLTWRPTAGPSCKRCCVGSFERWTRNNWKLNQTAMMRHCRLTT